MFIAELTGVYFTGGSLNPARSFGPAVVNRSFKGYHWIYWVGPLLGALVASGFYKFIKVLEYETANPGQDQDHLIEVEKRKDLLVAAGINELDARHVARGLIRQESMANQNRQPLGSIGPLMANGQGRNSNDDPAGMYGTKFRNNAAGAVRDSATSDTTCVQEPSAAIASGTQHGQFAYLCQAAPAIDPRVNSPSMTTNDQLYAALEAGGDAAMGDMVGRRAEARARLARTGSSNV